MLVFHGVARQRWRKANGRARGYGGDGILERLIERGSDARRRVLGVSVALSQAEIHWQSFLASLVTSSMRVLEFMASYDRARLRAIRRATSRSNARQRCEFRLAQSSALPRMPSAATRISRFANASGANSAPRGTPLRWTRPRSRLSGRSRVIAAAHQSWRGGCESRCLTTLPASLFSSRTAAICIP